MKPTLLVLAAGIGSRYGGLKQMDPIGPHGEFIPDYSVGDALAAGFSRVVFVIRRDIEAAFRALVGARWEKRADVAYAFQRLDDLLAGPTAITFIKGYGCKNIKLMTIAQIARDIADRIE